MAKEQFKSKRGFILACVGAAVGLGNALRFPGLCARFGGGAFLFIYFVALVLLGVPLLNAEIALGRKYGGGAPRALYALRRGGARIGWAACINSFFTAILYAGLAGWLVTEIIHIVPLASSAELLSQSEISGYFFDNVLGASSDGSISSISPLVLAATLLCLAVMFFCLKGGANSLACAAKFTVFAPVTLLIFMAVRGLMFGNSATALRALFVPDFTRLSSPELWLNALGQVFFSLSVAVGIMPAFGSYLPEGANVFSCSLYIAAADFLVSVLAAVVMFTTLYGCGLEGSITSSGIITAFAVYPAAIASLFQSPALNAAVGAVFYASLAMMAVQSASSMMEAAVTPLQEAFGIKRGRLVLGAVAIGAVICPFFATSAGVIIVEISDRFVNFYDVLVLCAAECIVIGLGCDTRKLSREVNRFGKRRGMPAGLLSVSVKILSPFVLISLSIYEVLRLIRSGLGYPPWALAAFGWGLSLAVALSGFLFASLSRRERISA